MEHGLESIIPILEILEIEICNILYNPGNIGKCFSILSYPGKKFFFYFTYPQNIGSLSFPFFPILEVLENCFFYYPGHIGKHIFHIPLREAPLPSTLS